MGLIASMKGRFSEFLKSGDKKVKIITILGIAGILLIFLSQFAGSGKAKTDAEASSSPGDAKAYAAQLQQELSALISQIEGAGKTSVLVTLQNDWETLYVSEEKTDRDSTQNKSGEGAVTERQTREENYVLVDGKDGRTALVKTRMEPVVKGVVIVCEGGDNPLTATRILDCVTTALAISSAKVCITKCS